MKVSYYTGVDSVKAGWVAGILMLCGWLFSSKRRMVLMDWHCNFLFFSSHCHRMRLEVFLVESFLASVLCLELMI